jgi:murein L,D-transpeptidase YafK
MNRTFFLFLVLSSFTQADVDLVKVDKSERVMYLMAGSEVVKKYHVALGANPKGHKRQEGDEKTPEGVYQLDYINENSSYYRSMHVSYPNSLDTASAEKNGVSPGGFIMVHGQRNGFGWLAGWTQKRNWTDGCIALKNSEMDEFLELVEVGTAISIQW